MSRALVIIRSQADRLRVASWATQAPTGTRVEFKESKRSLPQNDRMWAMLTDIARQATLQGRKFTVEQWKTIFMHALGKETELLPALEGNDFIPARYSSSDLSKGEMSDLIELMLAWGAENAIRFNDPMESPSIADGAPAEEGDGV